MQRILVALLIALGAVTSSAAPRATLVVWAPGFPGDTEQAQQTMDELAGAVRGAAGWSRGTVRAVYHATLAGGLEALAASDAAVALVPAPVYFEYRERLGLDPVLQVELADGADEVWSLVAKKGRVSSPRSLDGWELAGAVGYAPGFVRGPLLGSWGELPASARITFTPRVLSALRRTAGGENVAVLADRAQTGALGALPFADELEVVTRSAPLPASFVCTVGDRLASKDLERLRAALLSLDGSAGGREVLATMRLARFAPLDADAVARLRP